MFIYRKSKMFTQTAIYTLYITKLCISAYIYIYMTCRHCVHNVYINIVCADARTRTHIGFKIVFEFCCIFYKFEKSFFIEENIFFKIQNSENPFLLINNFLKSKFFYVLDTIFCISILLIASF